MDICIFRVAYSCIFLGYNFIILSFVYGLRPSLFRTFGSLLVIFLDLVNMLNVNSIVILTCIFKDPVVGLIITFTLDLCLCFSIRPLCFDIFYLLDEIYINIFTYIVLGN